MDLSNYQAAALTTAKPTALDLHKYLAPALFSEVGELLDVFSKGHRDGETPENIAINAVKEYGDCYWMTAVALHLHRVSRIPSVSLYSQTRESALQHLATQAAEVVNDPDDVNCWIEMAHRLNEGCQWVTGELPLTVLGGNLAKLKDRANRGAITGSGDSR